MALSEPKKVMVVDDDDINRLVASVLLERRNYRVIEAKNGPEAIDLVKTEPVNFVLMDLSMPGMDGLETTRRIREDNPSPNLLILALTAHTSPQHQQLCYQAGMNAVLRKPFDSEQLDKLMALLNANVHS